MKEFRRLKDKSKIFERDPKMRHIEIAYQQVTTPPPIPYKGCEKRDKCFIVVPIVQGLVLLSTITIIMGVYALYHCFMNITTDTVYCVVLLGMIIPNIIGDAHIASWLINDKNDSRDNLATGVALNLMGILA